MSDREGGVGAFVLGIALGAVLGLVFAPGPGDETRANVARRLRNLRDLAEEKVDDVRSLVAGDEDEHDLVDAEDEAGDEEVSPAEEVRRRLGEARRRRRGARTTRRGSATEEDEPVA